MDDEYLMSVPDIQEALGGRSRAYVYANVLPHVEVVKVGITTNATRGSVKRFIASLPRVKVRDAQAPAAA